MSYVFSYTFCLLLNPGHVLYIFLYILLIAKSRSCLIYFPMHSESTKCIGKYIRHDLDLTINRMHSKIYKTWPGFSNQQNVRFIVKPGHFSYIFLYILFIVKPGHFLYIFLYILFIVKPGHLLYIFLYIMTNNDHRTAYTMTKKTK
jgi:hypothetical protein